MSKLAHPSLLRRLMGQKLPVVPERDPADMGTAIGLDFCLDEPPPEPSVAAAPHQAPPSGWLRRLADS
jgi:hypothetical protein